MENIQNIQITDIKIRDDLYPRQEHNPKLVENYTTVIDKLPPIDINQNNELIDGKHRLLAHRTAKCDTIKAIITETASDIELLELSVEKNASHGMQLSLKDKRSTAIKLYLGHPPQKRIEYKKRLIGKFSVTMRTINNWTKDIDDQTKKERTEKIYDMWLSCHSQTQIAETVGITQETVKENIKKSKDLGKLSKTFRFSAEFQDQEFEPPIYNYNWSWSKKAEGISHPGNTDPRIVQNLLYLYTEPFDIVVDPFAGGGSTIDICKKRLRRYYISLTFLKWLRCQYRQGFS